MGGCGKKLLTKFFPRPEYISARSTTTSFSQGVDEPICEAWERYKSLLNKC